MQLITLEASMRESCLPLQVGREGKREEGWVGGWVGGS